MALVNSTEERIERRPYMFRGLSATSRRRAMLRKAVLEFGVALLVLVGIALGILALRFALVGLQAGLH